jgi:hypothetical protein
MQTPAIIPNHLGGASVVVQDALVLRVGAEVVARVVALSAEGSGLLSLAGRLVRARLPEGLQAGMRLRLVVAGTEAEQVVLRLKGEERLRLSEPELARLAGTLALQGDGELLRAALELAGPAVPLPEGATAEVAVDPDEGQACGEREAASARLVLHSPLLGAIEATLRLDAGGLRARVVADPGEAADRARRLQAELVTALERAAGAPVVLEIAGRPERAPRPRPLLAPESFDAYA